VRRAVPEDQRNSDLYRRSQAPPWFGVAIAPSPSGEILVSDLTAVSSRPTPFGRSVVWAFSPIRAMASGRQLFDVFRGGSPAADRPL
jgi:hypothetical protein